VPKEKDPAVGSTSWSKRQTLCCVSTWMSEERTNECGGEEEDCLLCDDVVIRFEGHYLFGHAFCCDRIGLGRLLLNSFERVQTKVHGPDYE
jgi:hypothetical protein